MSVHQIGQSADGYTHPLWCDLAKCEPATNLRPEERPHGVHYSTGTLWGVQTDEAEFLVELIRSDDYDGAHNNHAPTQLKVTLQQMVSDTDDPRAGCYADAWVDPEDARMLAAILNRYADLADRSNRHGIEGSAQQVPRRRRV